MKNGKTFGELLTRREFLKRTSLGLIGAGLVYAGLDTRSLLAALKGGQATKKGKMFFRKLGKTGISISEISFNGGVLKDLSVLSYAMDMGLNFIDTAPAYGDGKSEMLIGKLLKYRPKDLIVATKWKVNEQYRVKEYEESVNASLKNLNVDTIDIIQAWAVMRKSQVNHEPMFEAFEKLKQAGKVRYLGITTHRNEVEVSGEIVRNGRYDTMTVAYNYKNYEQMTPIIEQASKKGMGIIGQFITEGVYNLPNPFSKTKKGAVEWALQNTDLDSVIVDLRNIQEVDELLRIPEQLRK